MKIRHFPASLFATIALSACGAEETPAAPEEGAQPVYAMTEAQSAHLDRMIGNFVNERGYPSIAIGIVSGDELVWSRGMGQTMTPDVDTYFRPASMVKVLTAMALIRLEEDGVLSLDDEVAAWLPEAEDALSRPGRPPITLRHLLSHASGLPFNYPGLIWTAPDPEFTEADIFAAISSVEFDHDPGEAGEITRMNAVLAGLVIERASGQSYRAFVSEQIIAPLGMRDTTWEKPNERLAPGHSFANFGGYRPAAPIEDTGIFEPAVGLFSTIRDLARLVSHGLGHLDVLRPESLEASLTPQADLRDSVGFGLGWAIVDSPGLGNVVTYGGSYGGYTSYIQLLPEHGLGVIVAAGAGENATRSEMQSVATAVLASLVAPEAEVRPRPSVTEHAVRTELTARILDLVNDPTLARVEAAYHPQILEALTPQAIVEHFARIGDAAGTCFDHQLLEDRGYGVMVLRLSCTQRDVEANVIARYLPPYPLVDVAFR